MSSCKICHKTAYKKTATAFFRFPRNEKRCQLWAEKCGLLDDFLLRGSAHYYKTYRICSDHFRNNVIGWNGKKKFLLNSAVPELALNLPPKAKIPFSPRFDDEPGRHNDDLLACNDAEFRLQMTEHLCRLCGEEHASLTRIFGQHGQSQNLPNKIKFLPVLISEHDVMPSKVCRQCIKQVENNFNFFTRCLESDQKIRIMLDMKDQETTYQIEQPL